MLCASILSCPLRDLLGRSLSDFLSWQPGIVRRRPSETFSVFYSPLTVLSVAASQRSPIPLSQWDLSPPLIDLLTLYCVSLDLLGRPLRDLFGCPLQTFWVVPSVTFSIAHLVLSIAAAPNRDLLTLCCVSLDLLGRPLRDLLGRPLRDLLVAHVVLFVATPQRLPIPLFQ